MTELDSASQDQAREGARRHLVLSLFPGIDLLGRGFEAEGFCVVKGPDPLWGQHVESFSPPSHVFAGVIGGPPCPNFSGKNRNRDFGEGIRLLNEFARCVAEADPDWWLMENVIGVPDVNVTGYKVQRFNLNASECGLNQNRPRRFQFGSKDGKPLVINRGPRASGVSPCVLASEGKSKERRTWPDFCELQGLSRDFQLPGWPVVAKYRAVGNGVPIPMARVIAVAIQRRPVTPMTRLCVCECGRAVPAGRTMATAACRKRMQRKRDTAGNPDSWADTVTGPGTRTPGAARRPPSVGAVPRENLWDWEDKAKDLYLGF